MQFLSTKHSLGRTPYGNAKVSFLIKSYFLSYSYIKLSEREKRKARKRNNIPLEDGEKQAGRPTVATLFHFSIFSTPAYRNEARRKSVSL